eukprot:tig00020938_g16139.t1
MMNLQAVLPYVPGGLLATAPGIAQLKALQAGQRVSVATYEGAGLLLDIAGFSALARDLTRSNSSTACEKLTETLNAFFLELMKRLHSRGVEILLFAGTSNERRSMGDAIRLAAEAAIAVQSMSFKRNKHRLVAHTGLGAGFLQQNLIAGTERAAQAIYTGDLVRQVCEAQRSSKDTDIVVSPEALGLLQPISSFGFEPPGDAADEPALLDAQHLAGAPPDELAAGAHRRPPAAAAAAAAADAAGAGVALAGAGDLLGGLLPRLPPRRAPTGPGTGPSTPLASGQRRASASQHPRGSAPQSPGSLLSAAGMFNTLGPTFAEARGRECECGALLPAASVAPELALAPFEAQVMSLAPAAVAGGEQKAFWASDIRTVYVIFASFPELDIDRSAPKARTKSLAVARLPPELEEEEPLAALNAPRLSSASGGAGGPGFARRLSVGPGPGGDGETAEVDAHAARFGKVVRAVHRVCEVYGGAVNKVFLDDKGASALLGFGLPGFVHEDDSERAVRAAIDLATWFEETDAPFACGIAGGRTFVGTLGAPCRKEYALIGDSVILAARMMSEARVVIAKKGAPRSQEVYCDASVFEATTADRHPPFVFEEREPFKAKGFAEPVRIFRPRGMTGDETRDQSKAEYRGPKSQATPIAIFGREEEMEKMVPLLARHALEGRGATIVLEGKAGMGKTHIRRELQRLAARRGTPVFSASGSAVESSTPLSCVRAMVAALVPETRTEEGLRGALAQGGLLREDEAAFLWRALFEEAGEAAAPGDEAASTQRSMAKTARSVKRSFAVRAASGSGSGKKESGGSGPGGAGALGQGALARLAMVLFRLVAALVRLRSNDSAHGGEAAAAALGPGAVGVAGGAAGPVPVLEDLAGNPPFALFVEDGHFVDSASWAVLHNLRDVSSRMLLVLVTRPMQDPPLDFIALSTQPHASRRRLAEPQPVELAGGTTPRASANGASPRAAAAAAAAAAAGPRPRAPHRPPSPGAGATGEGGPGSPASSGGESPRRAWFAATEGERRAGAASARSLAEAASSAASPGRGSNNSSRRRLTFAEAAAAVLYVRLSPLSREASEALLSRMLDGLQMPARDLEYLRQELLAKAEGVPLYIVEMSRHVLRARVAAQARGLGGVDLTSEIPSSIQKVVLSQVDALASHVQAVLKLCAVIGSGFTVQLLNAIDISGWAPPPSAPPSPPSAAPASSAATATATRRRTRRTSAPSWCPLVAGGGRGGRSPGHDPSDEVPHSFTHGIVKEAVYQGMTQAVKRDVHCNYAAHIEASAAGRDPAVLALHWRLGEQHDRALEFLERAATRAVARGAIVEARRLLSEIVETIDAFSLAGKLPRLPERFHPQGLSRWRRVRWAALRAWANLETMLGRSEDVECLAGACLETLGEPVPSFKPSFWSKINVYARVAKIVLTEPKAARPRVKIGQLAAGEEAQQQPQQPPQPQGGGSRPGTPTAAKLDGRTEEEIAVVDCLVLIGRSVLRAGRNEKAAGGGPADNVFHVWVASLVRALELSYSCKVEAEPHAKALAYGAYLLLALGHQKLAQKMIARADAIADRLGEDAARASVWTVRGTLECTAGRFGEGHALFERTIEHLGLATFPGVEPATLSLVTLFLAGRLEEAEERAQALVAFLSRLARDAFARPPPGAPRGPSASWVHHTAAILIGLFIWRTHGDTSKMLEASRGLLFWWQHHQRGVTWPYTLAIFCVLDFLHHRSSAAREHLDRVARLRKAASKIAAPQLTVSGGAAAAPAGAPHLVLPAAASAGLEAEPFRSASEPKPASLIIGADDVRKATGSTLRSAQQAAEQAAGELRDAMHLMEATAAKRLPALGPLLRLFAAERPGLSPRQRAAALRQAREGLAQAGLALFEAAALVRLALAEPDPAAAAEAAAAAAALCDESGLELRALLRLQSGDASPRGDAARGRYVSIWI